MRIFPIYIFFYYNNYLFNYLILKHICVKMLDHSIKKILHIQVFFVENVFLYIYLIIFYLKENNIGSMF